MQQYELTHHGVKGMKWGVRRYQNPDGSLTPAGQKRYYGMSKRQLKRRINTSNDENLSKVTKEWSAEIRSNSTYRKLGEQSTEVAKAIRKSEKEDFLRDPDGDISDKTMKLYEKHYELDEKMREIEVSVGKKYIQQFNDARLKDIAYPGTIEKGREMLETYGKNYTVWGDGTIRSGFGFGRNNYVYDDKLENLKYIRPRNMD